MKRKLVTAAVIAGALLSMVAVRVVCSSKSEYQKGKGAEKKATAAGDKKQRQPHTEDAIAHYRRAARWYAPGNAYVSRSLEALNRIGLAAEKRADLAIALMAYRAMRRAILGARSFYTPHRERLNHANARIARLSARAQLPMGSAIDLEKAEAWHKKQLAKDTAPSVAWSILALLAFVGWVGSAVGFIYRAIGPEDRLVARQALIWGAATVCAFGLWVLGLSQA